MVGQECNGHAEACRGAQSRGCLPMTVQEGLMTKGALNGFAMLVRILISWSEQLVIAGGVKPVSPALRYGTILEIC